MYFLIVKRAPLGVILRRLGVLLGFICGAMGASGQATLTAIVVKAIAEVELKSLEDGHETVVLSPATRVAPGDAVIYTLEIRNKGSTDILGPVITQPVPTHTRYVADSATGPGAEVTYSTDGGSTFDRTENLRVLGTDRQMHRATADDYTHVRWRLRITLKSKSVAYARFRAIVQ